MMHGTALPGRRFFRNMLNRQNRSAIFEQRKPIINYRAAIPYIKHRSAQNITGYRELYRGKSRTAKTARKTRPGMGFQ